MLKPNDARPSQPKVGAVLDGTAGGSLWPTRVQFAAAVDDVSTAIQMWPTWTQLGLQEIRMRYRRTTLGPFWMTLNMGLTVMMIGFVFGKLFKADVATYMPYVVSGVVMWNAITSIMNEGSNCYVSFSGHIKQMKQPYFLYILIIFWRNFLAFLHNVVIIPAILLFFWIMPTWAILLFPINLLLVFIALLPYALIAALISARFRDVPQFVANFLTALFFVSPIIWRIEALGEHAHLAYLNPISHLLELVREPLLGNFPKWYVFLAVTFMAVAGWLMALVVFARFRARIPYWV